MATIKRAEGDAESITIVSKNEAAALETISQTLDNASRHRTIDYILLQHYMKGYQNILKNSRVVVVPKSKEGQNNDFLNLAAMMMFNNNSK